ncbi:hypothetical protein RNAN_0018 [Rheinheimera nanhaiensis E407-8]|uniref:Uncharacterized protein n=1 Tax=Rheinheimera nanhaiensis E407-8 TaxID=562729 RepID=I1DSM7_9GAMM|nr:hypothetical protein RNAN_0018 [Rheinheimera nanhaiensis E407-8]
MIKIDKRHCKTVAAVKLMKKAANFCGFKLLSDTQLKADTH